MKKKIFSFIVLLVVTTGFILALNSTVVAQLLLEHKETMDTIVGTLLFTMFIFSFSAYSFRKDKSVMPTVLSVYTGFLFTTLYVYTLATY